MTISANINLYVSMFDFGISEIEVHKAKAYLIMVFGVLLDIVVVSLARKVKRHFVDQTWFFYVVIHVFKP